MNAMSILKKTGLLLLLGIGISHSAHSAPQVIELTQVPCQFLESENDINHGYSSSNTNDCKKINKGSAEQRLNQSNTITLKPGKYTFRVSNKDVPYTLGFWLRGKGPIGFATLPAISGGGLKPNSSKDYTIDLKEGEIPLFLPTESDTRLHAGSQKITSKNDQSYTGTFRLGAVKRTSQPGSGAVFVDKTARNHKPLCSVLLT